MPDKDQLEATWSFDRIAGRSGAQPASTAAEFFRTERPERIGRYRVERLLGEGGFGLVCLAHDDQLNRQVAIKVPHPHLVKCPEDAELYLTEARTVANLDHPNIVPVYDIGSTEDWPCYVVSKFIDGTDLASRRRQAPLALHEAIELVATISAALHYAHRKGLVHRDIKPGNILLDSSGKPYIADFGLALREENVGRGPNYAGTPVYMSPEQARGEGHRVDGRSDIFSLGVVFYELLTGRRPFKGATPDELIEQITSFEPRPPRQYEDAIPPEVERICLKALAKRASERYTAAKDMADDLRHFLLQSPGPMFPAPASAPIIRSADPASTLGPSDRSRTPSSDGRPIKIVPKGLRSFDAHDADFFLELLPGPRDRDGLPEAVRFWKTRIEEMDAENTFSTGLICGPSGCGKSSLVKAGLLPRLADTVITVYVEATANDTESRLLAGLRKRCPFLGDSLSLKDTLAALRRGQGIPPGKKVVIVLDQFEQWLHARMEVHNTELVQSLRQCDGARVQCVFMVRDDFWMAVIRFMRELEVPLVEGQNSGAVDLFPIRHAQKVMAALGRAFGVLPDGSNEASREQKEFLKQAVAGLAQDGRVICVRLALFAEMMKGKTWTPATLREVGGTQGVGAAFLEETFSSATAPPAHRYHQKAARAVLKALLPDSGTDLKGHMRSFAELLEASGYRSRPKDFDDLIRILDSEIRLITPTDPEGKEQTPGSRHDSSERYYQLAHDYLVHSLRDWLSRKQKETRRGRAELMLADRASVWNARPENRQLPSHWQCLQIHWLTDEMNWTLLERKLMARAGKVHMARGLAFAALVVVAAMLALAIERRLVEQRGATTAASLVQRVLDAETGQVPGIVREIGSFRKWTDPLLREAINRPAASARDKLHASLALLPVDKSQVAYLHGRLLEAEPAKVAVLRHALLPHKQSLLAGLWKAVDQPEKGKEAQRLRAAAALAEYDPNDSKWPSAAPAVASDLVGVPAVYSALWEVALHPVCKVLIGPLSAIYRDNDRRETERSLATDFLADYAADQPELLADLLMDSDEKQFAMLYPRFSDLGSSGLPALSAEIDKKLPPDTALETRNRVAKRQANAAAALLRMNESARVWPLLALSSDPSARSYMIHRFARMAVDPKIIIDRLADERNVSVRRALLLSLGEYLERDLTPEDRKALIPTLKRIYQTAADPGLHAAAEWLLRQWQQSAWLAHTNDEWTKDRDARANRLRSIKESLSNRNEKAQPQWYSNGQGQTMVVIPGPVEFLMGSPATESDRKKSETQHRKRIGRTFALAANTVTLDQYTRFDKGYHLSLPAGRAGDLPVVRINWYMAARYCNWLSQAEGIPPEEWCYEIKGEELVTMRPKYLSLTGYRLPTESEYEYATRAGALTSRFYGETEDLLDKYAWYQKNSQNQSQPVGLLKPNDLGLFDVQGNAYTWCQNASEPYRVDPAGAVVEDQEEGLEVAATADRILRGCSYTRLALELRSAFRNDHVPSNRNGGNGIRPARTFPP